MRITLAKRSRFNSRTLARDLSRLVMINHEPKPFMAKVAPSFQSLKKYHQACIEMAMKRGICEPLYTDEKLSAFIVIGMIELAPGYPIYWGFIETDRSKAADVWLLRKMLELREFFRAESMFDIPHYLKHLLPQFYKMGFYIDTVRTVGEPRLAYSRLMKQRNPTLDRAAEKGFSVQKLKLLSELKQIRSIEKAEFKRNPQYGWFVSSDAWLDQALERRKADLKNPESCLYVIKKGRKVLGYFGASPQPSTFKGKFAGTDFTFDQSIQGKGFSTLGYRLLLEHMMERKVDFFLGNTAQSPTLKLAKILGRKLQNYSLRFGKSHFSEKHFSY